MKDDQYGNLPEKQNNEPDGQGENKKANYISDQTANPENQSDSHIQSTDDEEDVDDISGDLSGNASGNSDVKDQ